MGRNYQAVSTPKSLNLPNPDKHRHKPRQNPSIKLLRYRFGQMQARQDFERSRLQYDEAVRNKDYQLAQLEISLSAVKINFSEIGFL